MTSAHNERRAARIRSVHRPTRRGRRRACAACGQSWPCTDYAWASGDPTGWTARDAVRVAAAAVLLVVVVPGVTHRLLPVWAWLTLLVLSPVAVILILAAVSRRSR